MKFLLPLRIAGISLIVMALVSVVTAVAAANTVPSTRVTDQSSPRNLNALKPAACAGITVTNLVTGSGIIAGTAANDLILGSSGIDTITDIGGNDCILGGGGNDIINGGPGTDVCIGGPGTDTFIACETQIQ